MAMYRSEDWKDGSEDDLTAEQQRAIRSSMLVGLGVVILLVATTYLVSLTVDAMRLGVFDQLPAIL